MKHTLKLLFMFLLILSLSKTEAQKKVKYDGFVELGEEVVYKELYVQGFVRSKLEFKLDLNKRTEVELDIRAYSDQEQIELHEASVEYEISKSLEVAFGQLKKGFGKEEMTSRENLKLIQRSFVNRYLSPFGYVSRDPGIHVKWENKEEEILAGIFYNNSHNLTLMTRYIKRNILGFNSIGAGLHIVRHFNQKALDNSYAASLDFSRRLGEWDNDLELFFGTDPQKSSLNNIAGIDEDVNFFAVKLKSAYKFVYDNTILRGIEPIMLLGMIVPDTENFDVNKYQFLIGLNIYIDDDIRFMINGDLILSNNKMDKNERTLFGSNAMAQLQVRW